jgi:hypothetical protein
MSEVESINPNTPVTSSLTKNGTIEADATGGPLSFDELEEVTKTAKRAKAEKKDKTEDKQEKSKDLTSDTDKGKKAEAKETKKESKEAKESSESVEAKDAANAEKIARKILKAKMQDKDFDLDEETLVPVKINGKEEMVQVKDLLGNYSGKVAWDKKFSEIDQNRKTLSVKELKLKEVEDTIKQIYEEQDPNMKMFKMSTLAGIDPVEFRNKFFNENISLLEKYYNMSDDERKADALSYEANIHKHRADTLEKSIKEKQSYEELQTKVAQLRERHQISEQEFVSKYDQVEAQAKAGQLDPKLMSPEYIIAQVSLDRIYDAGLEKLNGLDLGWSEQVKAQKLKDLAIKAYQIGLEPKDIADTIDELWGVKKAQKKIEEKKKENQEFLSGKKEVAQAKTQSSEVWSFDQM